MTDSTWTCCEPHRYAGPTGVFERHSFSCPWSPGQRIRTSRPDNLASKHRAQTLHVGLEDSIAAHPASGVLTAYDARCPVHRTEPAEDCGECSDRRLG